MRYCCERERHLTHNLRYDECDVYWFVYDRKRGFKEPVGMFYDAADAQRFVKLLNAQDMQ